MGITKSKIYAAAALILALLPILLFFRFFFAHVANIPSVDDFTIAGQALDMREGKDFWHTLIKNHNEHRVITARLGFYFLIALGNLDFSKAMLFGLPLWGLLFYLIAYNSGVNSLFKHSVAFLLAFNLCYHTNIFMGMTSIQNLGIVVFAGISAFFYQRAGLNTEKYGIEISLSVLFGLLAGISGGNGMFIFIALGVLTLINKDFKSAGIYLTVLLLFAAWYFTGYQAPANNPDAGIGAFFKNPLPRIVFFLSFLASPFSVIFPGALTYSLFGTLLAIGVLPSLYSKAWLKQRPFFTALLWFCILTGMAAAINRAGASGALADSPFSTRFAHYGLVIILITILFYWEKYQNHKPALLSTSAMLMAFLIFAGSFYSHARDVKYLKGQKLLSVVNYTLTGYGLDHNTIYHQEAVRDYERLSSLGLYKIPEVSNLLVKEFSSDPETKPFDGLTTIEYKENQSLWLSCQYTDDKLMPGVGTDLFFALRKPGAAQPSFILPSYPIPAGGFKGFRNLASLLDFNDKGAIAIIRARFLFLEPGTYEVCLWHSGIRPYLLTTGKTCEIKSFVPDPALVPTQTP